MKQRTISFLIKPSHPDYAIVKEQSVQSRRLFNGLNSVARIVHAKNKLKYTSVEEQPVDQRLVQIFGVENWVDGDPYLAAPYVFEKIRKSIEQVQEIVLPQKVAQRVGISLSKNWKSFYALRKQGIYSNPPGFKQKYGIVEYTKQALGLTRTGYVKPSGWGTGMQLPVYIKNSQVQAGRLIHSHSNIFKLEIIYTTLELPLSTGTETASIDFGLNNLVTLVSTKQGERPKIVTGKHLKSVNQKYNKIISKQQTLLNKGGETKSNKINTLYNKRSRIINHELHSVSAQVISYLVHTGTGTLIIGWNNGFKDNINIGKRNNQNFVQIPHAKLRDMLKYKAEAKGIKVIIQEESYTSKASFIDNDNIPVYPTQGKQSFSGSRLSRGNYRSKDKVNIHADVNGAWNIMRKSNPTICWSSGIIVMPERLTITC